MKNSIALIDYGMGNLKSVKRALEICGAKVNIINVPAEISDEKAIVFPGQGSVGPAMKQLRANGFDRFLKKWISENKPFMGICLGLQLLFDYSEENETECHGVIAGKVKRYPENGLKIPHMGWNEIRLNENNLGNVANKINKNGDSFYFVHSYYVEPKDESIIWSTSEYGIEFVSGIQRANVFAVQFHPEKSQEKGLQLYKNFLNSVGNLA